MSVSAETSARERVKPSRFVRGAERLIFGVGGIIVGVILTLTLLALLAPGPAVPSSAPASSADVTVTVDDAYLSAQIADGLAQANLPITLSNVQCSIAAQNSVTVSGEASLLGGLFPHKLVAQGHVYVSGGHLAAKIDSVDVGGLSVPAAFYSALQDQLNSQLQEAFPALTAGGAHYAVTGVSSTPGHLTVALGKQ